MGFGKALHLSVSEHVEGRLDPETALVRAFARVRNNAGLESRSPSVRRSASLQNLPASLHNPQEVHTSTQQCSVSARRAALPSMAPTLRSHTNEIRKNMFIGSECSVFVIKSMGIHNQQQGSAIIWSRATLIDVSTLLLPKACATDQVPASSA